MHTVNPTSYIVTAKTISYHMSEMFDFCCVGMQEMLNFMQAFSKHVKFHKFDDGCSNALLNVCCSAAL